MRLSYCDLFYSYHVYELAVIILTLMVEFGSKGDFKWDFYPEKQL
jgi:hypothetical protein